MARQARKIKVNKAIHVVVNGIEELVLFRNDEDRFKYLQRFKEKAEELKVKIHDFCLLSTHAHFLLRTKTQDGLAKLMQSLQSWWGGYRNKSNKPHRRKGSVFQERYYSVVIKSRQHFLAATRYIQRNAVETMPHILRAEDYLFCSTRIRLGLSHPVKITLESAYLRQCKLTGDRLRQFLEGKPRPEHQVTIRNGWPRYETTQVAAK